MLDDGDCSVALKQACMPSPVDALQAPGMFKAMRYHGNGMVGKHLCSSIAEVAAK